MGVLHHTEKKKPVFDIPKHTNLNNHKFIIIAKKKTEKSKEKDLFLHLQTLRSGTAHHLIARSR